MRGRRPPYVPGPVRGAALRKVPVTLQPASFAAAGQSFPGEFPPLNPEGAHCHGKARTELHAEDTAESGGQGERPVDKAPEFFPGGKETGVCGPPCGDGTGEGTAGPECSEPVPGKPAENAPGRIEREIRGKGGRPAGQ